MAQAEKYGISQAEFEVVKKQAAMRAEMRREFLKQRTNPWKNAAEAGYVFDAAHQRFLALKVTRFEFFKPTKSNGIFAMLAIVLPMTTYGCLIWNERNNREQKIRKGELLYKDRLFKLC